MKVYFVLQSFTRRAGPSLSSNGFKRAARSRGFGTVVPTPDTLPLSGVRVLDMTRILAGVSYLHLQNEEVSR
jgi:hypothetical protein